MAENELEARLNKKIEELRRQLNSLGVYTKRVHGEITHPSVLARIIKYLKGTTGGDILGTANRVVVTNGEDSLAKPSDVTLSLPQDIHAEAVPTFEGLTLLHSDATAILKMKRGNTVIASSDVLARIDIETSDVDDPGICATLGALSYGTSGETGWRFQVGTPSALVEALQIDPYGFVGVGTPWPDSPDTILHIQHPTEPYFRITRKDTTAGLGDIIGRIEFETQDSGSPGVGAVIQAEAEGSAGEVGVTVSTGVGGTVVERIRIKNTGVFHLTTDLPTYANNAAALAGGLVAKDLYRTGGDPDLVCIVH